ncbi:MAG TPA: TraR/DksA C4-type zinc finger protein [Actinomycetota bacterium]|nr:TraR/DksA C4-type zinc finger protein [Actinomycetota bacterium]
MGTSRQMDMDAARKALEEEKTRLESLRATVETTSGELNRDAALDVSSVDQHPADLGTETFERTKDLAILETMDMQLQDITHAFKRIDDGTYGTCESCGEPIGEERLKAMPAARFCIKDQAATEKRARAD